MGRKAEILKELLTLSHELGKPQYNYVIIGEGNTSARVDDKTFFVKASGTNLASITGEQFVQMELDMVLTLLDKEDPTHDIIQDIYNRAKVKPTQKWRASVETLVHAVCLSYQGINYIAHTHPAYINMLTCAKTYPQNLRGRIYPDEIVVLGKESLLLKYINPGVMLARIIKQQMDGFIKKNNQPPKAIYLQNHGLIALGSTAREVENITHTADKAAQIRLGALQAGGINFLPSHMVEKIACRSDEKYREQFFKN